MKTVSAYLSVFGLFFVTSCAPIPDDDLRAEWGKAAKDWETKPSYSTPTNSKADRNEVSPGNRFEFWEDWTTGDSRESNNENVAAADDEEQEEEDGAAPKTPNVRDATEEW